MCLRNLRTDFNPTALAGGEWTYDGYSVSPAGPFGANPANPLVPDLPGTTLVGDDPEVDSDGVDAGFYSFTYAVESELGCVGEKTVLVEIANGRCPGGDFTKTVCSDDPNFSLVTEWNLAAGCGPVFIGTVENPDSPAGPGFSFVSGPPNYNFLTTLNADDPGEHVFTNTVVTPSTQPGFTVNCEDCTQVATGVVTLVTAAFPGTEQYVPYLSVCTDPLCEVQLGNLLLGTSNTVLGNTGNWVFVGPGPETFSVNGGPFVVYNEEDTIITGSKTGLVNFSSATLGTTYTFRYVTSPGLLCERDVEVDVYLGPEPDPGIPPANNTYCYRNFVNTVLGGNPEINLWDQLGGTPSTQGTWTVTGVLNGGVNTTQNAINLAISAAHDVGDETPTYFLNGTDNTFNFQTFRDNAGVGLVPVPPGTDITLTFTYTAALPGSYLCAECTPGSSSWNVRIVYGYNPGTTVYDSPATAYQCSDCTIVLNTLVTGEETLGTWKVAQSVFPGALTIPNLRINGGAPVNKVPGSTIGSYGVSTNWTDVPPGIYIVRYQAGGSSGCNEDLYVYIEVLGCEEPCDGDLEARLFFMEISEAITDFTINTIGITSFEVNGVEQLGGPEALGATMSLLPIVTGGGPCTGGCAGESMPATVDYVTNLVDVLNSLAVPGYYFDYPTAAQLNARCIATGKVFQMKFPACDTFSIELAYDYAGTPDVIGTWTQGGYTPGANGLTCYTCDDLPGLGTCLEILPDENIC